MGEVRALMLGQLSTKGPDILAVGGGKDSCILNKDRHRTFGLGDYTRCETTQPMKNARP